MKTKSKKFTIFQKQRAKTSFFKRKISEIEKYEKQKSDLISKINSVNDALNDTNVLTNVFENKVENKVKVIDHNDLKKKNSDLDELIKNIFSTKI
jgi:SMC interacting uncharacterized protein involved in chromosome segregation